MPTPTTTQSIYESSVDLFEKINEKYSGQDLETLNSQMSGVLRTLNEIRTKEIKGKE